MSPPIIERKDVPSEAKLPTMFGEFNIRIFHEATTGLDHVALTLGDMSGPDPVLIRVHSECLTGDAFGSMRCDCGPQLQGAMSAIVERGYGCILYLRQEGRGIGLHAKIQAYHLQDQGADTLDANLMLGLPGDNRDYKIGASMLEALNIPRVELLSNNPDKAEQLIAYGIDVVSRSSLVVGVGKENRAYLETKVERMGHKIDQDDLN
ncbi:MAG TPA: GTP cyclohydrolase II [Candidatus Poseidoniaceae archaeon]|mgnify:FL=1|nr:MAG TPA: GTP cyclohydrolase II [Candidatus Poseidoniales archaeon]HII10806.1 GTP cyclohydrolase II [Candidatus Poseidoniaceae archaeon]|tara:strand:- start:3448 stop:4068 length:621 start_codon:yes stop_codon:yes gene_type:complete